ncbi:nuclear transport factor 2 family protein [Aestuariibacter sp. AA17]|uniref:Nuclear transport factor 2 family protein n=1 Tax=Fluctibacter corallii TaxID=2984329 RepID=A0ABT3A4S9_9ALTE|nr:nuclear transport factor 2 family protein [Aestuariibacter sp. AA17]MCV2883676.1 nuclear transport factor 2 family protein [Aestuariibacter sp. AA17]
MKRFGLLLLCVALSLYIFAENKEKSAIERAVKDYIQSQHRVLPDMMANGIDTSLAKRTYWESEEGNEFILESTYEDMVNLAGVYNKNGDKFPASPRVDIDIYDIDERVASVKLTADDWIDYMHLYKNGEGQWKVINVLWQLNNINDHVSKKR